MKETTVYWEGEPVLIEEPETLDEFIAHGFVETEDDLIRLADYGWRIMARHAFLSGQDPNVYCYHYSGKTRKGGG